MGIGNTTPRPTTTTAAPPAEVTGRGTGIDEQTFEHKVRVIAKKIELNKPDRANALDVLAKVEGFEIGGLAVPGGHISAQTGAHRWFYLDSSVNCLRVGSGCGRLHDLVFHRSVVTRVAWST